MQQAPSAKQHMTTLAMQPALGAAPGASACQQDIGMAFQQQLCQQVRAVKDSASSWAFTLRMLCQLKPQPCACF